MNYDPEYAWEIYEAHLFTGFIARLNVRRDTNPAHTITIEAQYCTRYASWLAPYDSAYLWTAHICGRRGGAGRIVATRTLANASPHANRSGE